MSILDKLLGKPLASSEEEEEKSESRPRFPFSASMVSLLPPMGPRPR
jgi:hypothetical protein